MSRVKLALVNKLPPLVRWRAIKLYSQLTRSMTVGVRGFVRDAEGRVLLVRHSYIPGWHLPGGGVERGETAEEAITRELREEAGLRLTARPQLVSTHLNGTNHILLFEARAWENTTPATDGEIAERGWFAPDALPQDTARPTRIRIAERLGQSALLTRWDSAEPL